MRRVKHPTLDSKKERRSMAPVDPDEQYIDEHHKGAYAFGYEKDTEEERELTRELVRKYKEKRSKSSD